MEEGHGVPEKILEELRGIPDVSADPEARWDRFTTLGAGTAPFFRIGVRTYSALQKVIVLCAEFSGKIRVLGAGTDLIGSDRRSPDLFVSLDGDFKLCSFPGGRFLRAGAGCLLGQMIASAAEQGLGGISALCGIPGTVGGALAMNAGANGKQIGLFVRKVRVIDRATGKESVLEPDAAQWKYRTSPLPRNGIFTETELELDEVSIPEELEKIRLEKERRKRVTPAGRSAGSVFRNPGPDLPTAGKLLEEALCKGLTAGAYQVSAEHANWIVTRKDCLPEKREADVLFLIKEMQDRVRERTGIILQREIRSISE